MEFKVGDHVEPTKRFGEPRDEALGKLGVVAHISDSGVIRVNFPEIKDYWYYRNSELKLIAGQRVNRFKAGDVVRVIKSPSIMSFTRWKEAIGHTFTLNRERANNLNNGDEIVEDGNTFQINYRPESLQVIGRSCGESEYNYASMLRQPHKWFTSEFGGSASRDFSGLSRLIDTDEVEKSSKPKRKGIMSILRDIPNRIKLILDEKTRALYQLGWIKSDLEPSDEGLDELELFLFDKFSAEFGDHAVAKVKEIQAEEAKAKKNS